MPKLNKPIFIIDGLRTPIGSPFKSLKGYEVADLAALVMQPLIKKNKIKKGLIDEVILGNTVSAGVGQNFARKAVLLAGLPITIPAHTVNSVCGSGLQAVIAATHSLLAGHADLIMAGGAESATRAPYFIPKKSRDEHDDRILMDSLLFDGLTCSLSNRLMGELCEELAGRYGISRKQQDAFALTSHQKAIAAQRAGKFKKEIVPVMNENKQWVEKDDRPRKNANIDLLASITPAFKENGTITAGNACVPCDGASILLLASSAIVKKEGYKPMAKILGFSSVALKPEETFSGAIKAVKACLKDCRLNIKDIDVIEICESFAAQTLLTQQQLKIPKEKMNLWGGDTALGHPLGIAGARVLVTLVHILEEQRKKKGLACICFGSGGAMAIAIEAV